MEILEGPGNSVTYLIYPLLGGSGDLVSRVTMGIVEVITWVIRVVNLLAKSP